jgi:hypothetical protein
VIVLINLRAPQKEVKHCNLLKKVKLSLQQIIKAQRRSTGMTLLFLLTSALDGGGWSKPSPGRSTPRKDAVLIAQRSVVLDGYRKSPPGFDPQTLHSVASRYTV